LAIAVDQGIKGEQVVEVMTRLAVLHGARSAIRVDRSSSRRRLTAGPTLNGMTLDFSRPGKPTDGAFVEFFNGRLRDEWMNASYAHWFLSLAHARAKIEACRTMRCYPAWKIPRRITVLNAT
jgi:putative transposase